MRNIVGMFSTLPEAKALVHALNHAGVARQSISIIAGNEAEHHEEFLKKSKSLSTSTGDAALSSASTGGGVGLLAGLTVILIPGVGPIIAGGVLATLLTTAGIGATFGGLIGAFAQMGLPHERAPLFAEAVKRGKVVVLAQVPEEKEEEITSIFRGFGASDIQDSVDTWRSEGWSGPKVDPHPLFPSESDIHDQEMPETSEVPARR